MSTDPISLPFLVKVEGRAYSNHRTPEGVYSVAVMEERTLAHSACAAMNVARDYVPFLSENPDAFTLRVFRPCGSEVLVPRALHTNHDDRGFFRGRAKNVPAAIAYQ